MYHLSAIRFHPWLSSGVRRGSTSRIYRQRVWRGAVRNVGIRVWGFGLNRYASLIFSRVIMQPLLKIVLIVLPLAHRVSNPAMPDLRRPFQFACRKCQSILALSRYR